MDDSQFAKIDLESSRFVASISEKRVLETVQSHEGMVSRSGVVAGLVAVFLTFFWGQVTQGPCWGKCLSLIPATLLGVSIWKLLGVMKYRRLYYGLNENRFEELMCSDITEAVRSHIAHNIRSLQHNRSLLQDMEEDYNFAVRLLYPGFVAAVFLMIITAL